VHVQELFDLTGKVAIVTGGGRGIGRHLSIGLAEAGAWVFAASRKRESCEEVVKQIVDAGGRADAVEADVADPKAVESLVSTVLEQAGRLDILVNNAARVWASPTLEYSLDAWDKVFDLNVRGLFYLSQLAARHMAERGSGSIIHISSISAFRSAPDEKEPIIAYNASKGAVVSLTVDMAVKLADKGVRVNGIAPGPFHSSMLDHVQHDPEKLAKFNEQVPQKRSGGEDDIKGAVVFLASEASRFVTGHTLVVDGGMSCS